VNECGETRGALLYLDDQHQRIAIRRELMLMLAPDNGAGHPCGKRKPEFKRVILLAIWVE
jgi:hypothetical protein